MLNMHTKRILNRIRYMNSAGITIVEILVVLAIIAILSSVASPTVKRMMDSYKLRMASTDLISYMNMAKTKATKQNYTWTIDFAPVGYNGYEVFYTDNLGVKHTEVKVNLSTCSKKATYTKCYDNDINFSSPSVSEICDATEFRFNPNGLTNVGCVFISNKEHTGHYRVGLRAASGVVRIQKWNGSDWE